MTWDASPFRDEGDRLRHMNEIMRAKFARARAERALHEPYAVPHASRGHDRLDLDSPVAARAACAAMSFRRWFAFPVLTQLHALGLSLYDLRQEQRKIMTNLSDIAADVATIKQDVATVATVVAEEVADLRAQLAAAIANQDPAALQAVHDGLGDVHTSLTAIAAANSPAPAPTPAPTPDPAPAP
jgi:hypothetical protein